jgi:hypothetical protein
MAIEDEMKDVQQLVVNQLGVANGLNNSLADGQVTPDKLSAGAPTWSTSGNIFTNGGGIEINSTLVGDAGAYIDLHSTSASEPNYDARIEKTTGEDSNLYILNKGSGDTRIVQDDQIKFRTRGGNEGYTHLYAGGSGANGAHIELYGSTYSGEENNAYYDANRHRFRSAAGGTNPSYIDMNMTDDGNAELVVGSSDSSGEANLKVSSFTPSIIFEDKTTGSSDFQILADGNSLRFKSGNTSGDAQLTNEVLSINAGGTMNVRSLEINSTVTGTGPAFIDFHSTSATNPDFDARIINTDTGAFQFINTAGHFAFNLGQALGTFGLYDGNSFKVGVNAGTEGGLKCSRQGTDATNQIAFLNPNGQVGFINTGGSTTTYGTTSDYRLKEDITSIDNSIERLNQLKPCNFAWKVDGTRMDGFIAHEVQEVVPIAATGTKDAVKEDGTPDYQGIDQAKLVPLLTKALQEALTKIEALEARVTALEA